MVSARCEPVSRCFRAETEWAGKTNWMGLGELAGGEEETNAPASNARVARAPTSFIIKKRGAALPPLFILPRAFGWASEVELGCKFNEPHAGRELRETGRRRILVGPGISPGGRDLQLEVDSLRR